MTFRSPHLILIGSILMTAAVAGLVYNRPATPISLGNLLNTDNASAASNQTISTAPAGDTYIERNSTTTHGSDAFMRIQNDSSGSRFETYMKFDLSFIPSNATIVSETLNLYSIDGTSNGPKLYLSTMYYKNTTQPWTEYGLNWLNKPFTGTGSPIGDLGSYGTDKWVSYNLVGKVARAPVYLAMFADSTDSTRFATKENGNNAFIPYIKVNFTTP